MAEHHIVIHSLPHFPGGLGGESGKSNKVELSDWYKAIYYDREKGNSYDHTYIYIYDIIFICYIHSHKRAR